MYDKFNELTLHQAKLNNSNLIVLFYFKGAVPQRNLNDEIVMNLKVEHTASAEYQN